MELPNIEQYLSRFKVIHPVTLFEPTKEDFVNALLLKKCPLCSCNLYQTRNKKLWRCKSVRKDGFIIRDETLSKYR